MKQLKPLKASLKSANSETLNIQFYTTNHDGITTSRYMILPRSSTNPLKKSLQSAKSENLAHAAPVPGEASSTLPSSVSPILQPCPYYKRPFSSLILF